MLRTQLPDLLAQQGHEALSMGAKVKLNLPNSLWTAKDTARLASNTLAMIKLRTSEGLDADRKPFKDYSTKPIYVAFRGARLKPKGGRPSRTGRSIFYAGGYQQYKQESRRRGAGSSALVDLVASGALMNNLVVLHASAEKFIRTAVEVCESRNQRVSHKEYIRLAG